MCPRRRRAQFAWRQVLGLSQWGSELSPFSTLALLPASSPAQPCLSGDSGLQRALWKPIDNALRAGDCFRDRDEEQKPPAHKNITLVFPSPRTFSVSEPVLTDMLDNS